MQVDKKCVFCGTVKNCGPYLVKVFQNIEKMATVFKEYAIVLYYDNSSDDTLQKLKDYQLKNPKLSFYVNQSPTTPYRTHNIAKGRNYCLEAIRSRYADFEYFIMMDCDDVCSSDVNLRVLYKTLMMESQWDAISFNKNSYYDTWALSIFPLTFSCWHFKDYNAWPKYINKVLRETPKNSLIKCYSAFNGFAIYKLEKFANCFYDGRLRIDYIPKGILDANIRKSGPLRITKDSMEDCEHRFFHYSGILKNGARIRISPEIVFP